MSLSKANQCNTSARQPGVFGVFCCFCHHHLLCRVWRLLVRSLLCAEATYHDLPRRRSCPGEHVITCESVITAMCGRVGGLAASVASDQAVLSASPPSTWVREQPTSSSGQNNKMLRTRNAAAFYLVWPKLSPRAFVLTEHASTATEVNVWA